MPYVNKIARPATNIRDRSEGRSQDIREHVPIDVATGLHYSDFAALHSVLFFQ